MTVAGRGATVRLRTAPDGAWVLVGRISAIGGPAITAEPRDVTTLDAADGYKVWTGGLRDGGDLQLAAYWDNALAAQTILAAALDAGTTLYWWLTWPTSPTTDASFTATLAALTMTTATTEAIKTVVTARLTGPLDWSIPADATPATPVTYTTTALARETGNGNWPAAWPTPTLTATASAHGSDATTDALTTLHFTGLAAITTPVHYAGLHLSLAAFPGASAPTLRIRAALAGNPAAPTAGNPATYASALYTTPGWTSAARDIALTYASAGEYRADVTEIINELAALPGGTGAAVLFIIEPIEYADTRIDFTAPATTAPALRIYPSLAHRDYQTATIAGGTIGYFWPFDADDLGAQGTAPPTIRALVGTGHFGTASATYVANTDGVNQHLKITSNVAQYAAKFNIDVGHGPPRACYETTQPELRPLFGPDTNPGDSPDDLGYYGWPMRFYRFGVLWVVQGVHWTADHIEGWWTDVWGDTAWFSSFWEQNGVDSSGVNAWELGVSSGPPHQQNRPAAYRNNIGEVKTLVSYYERTAAPPRRWHAGYHNGDPAGGFAWSAIDHEIPINSDILGSGFGMTDGQMKQGVLMLEFQTTPRLIHVQQACERARKLWAAGVKAIPPILYP